MRELRGKNVDTVWGRGAEGEERGGWDAGQGTWQAEEEEMEEGRPSKPATSREGEAKTYQRECLRVPL